MLTPPSAGHAGNSWLADAKHEKGRPRSTTKQSRPAAFPALKKITIHNDPYPHQKWKETEGGGAQTEKCVDKPYREEKSEGEL